MNTIAKPKNGGVIKDYSFSPDQTINLVEWSMTDGETMYGVDITNESNQVVKELGLFTDKDQAENKIKELL